MEDIVINFTGQITEVENALEKVSAKIDDIESRLGNGFTSGAKNLVDSIRTELSNEKAYNPETFSEIASGLSPYVSNKLDVAQNKISSLMDLLKTGDTSESAFFTSLNQQSAFLAASINDVLNNCKELKQATSGLDKSQLKILNSSMPAIADSILTAGRGFLGIHGTGAPSVSTLAKTLLKTSTFKAGYDALAKEMKLDQTAQQQLLPVLTGTVLRSNMKYDYYKYARENSQGTLSKKDAEKYYYNFRDHLPDSLKSMPMNPTAITKAEMAASEAAKYDEVISRANYRKLVELAKENEVFRETLVNLGYGKYTANSKEAGVFSMISNRNMTKGTLAQIVGSTYYDQLKPAIEGNSVYYIPLGAENETEQRRIANRGNKRANQSFELLNMAQTINNGLAPLYMQEQYRPITDSEIKTRVGEVQRPRKDSYVVLSQTPEDFANGKLPEEKKVNWDWKNNRLTGTSSYIVMERSRMTELAGMHGNGTMGNGITGSVFDNPSMASKPKMLMVDYSGKILPKKEDGSLDYAAIAKGQWNEKAKEEIANIFTPNKQMMYTLDGENLVYNYPSVPRSINGEKQTYVPVTVKNGGILMVEEEQYKKTSKSSLETYGANIFNNFEDPNTVYDYYENANKIFEARNRNLTPSIPFSEVGGRIPKTSKTGLVDLKSVFGIDGAMFAMPGYIPGQNATIRMPGMNLKGVAQTFDWKSAIKDAYSLKDGDPFYVPGLNTPKELKNLYENGGLKAIQDNDIWGKEHYGNTLSKYFSDIMKLDMLIGDSLIKSPIFGVNELNYLSGADADAFMRDRLERMPEEDKFRLVETAAQHSTTRQLGLGTQMSQNLVMTKEDYAKNKALWEDYITQLSSNEEYQKKYVFNTNDAVDVAFREDPSILERTPAAQTRLQEALNAARLAMRKGQIFGRGEGSKISMYMALANPGMFMLKAAKANGYIGNGNEDAFKLGTGVIAGSPTLGQTSIAGGRFPNTFLEQFGLAPSVKMNELIKSGKYGLGKDGIYADADTLAQMGGGDFDGDQIQLVTGWIADIFKRTEKVRTEQIKSHTKQEAEEEMKKIGMPTDKNGNKIRTPSMIGDYLGRSVASSIFMGQVSNAMDSLSEIDWDNEEEVTRFAQAAVNLRKFYDIDSTYAKTGILKQLSFEDGTKRAELLGRPFTSVYKGLASAIENNDFTKMADFSKTNFASIYSNKTGIMMAALRGIPGDRTSYDKLINAQRDKQGITQDIPLDGEEIKTVENARAVYLDKNIKAMADQLLYGKVISTETAEDLESSLRIYSDMLGKELDSANGTSDLVRREKLQKFKWELNAQQRRINFLKNYGMTQANRDLGAGVAGYGMLSDVPMTGEDSAFERGLKEKEKELDQDNLRELRLNTIKAATAVADANEKLLPNGLTLEQVQNEKRAAAIRRANSLNYSYTMLNAFENANTPVKRKQWYDQYILGKDVKTFNPYSVLGKAFHDTAQIWEEETMNDQLGIENKEVHSIDKLIETFEEKLLKSQDDGHVYFKKNKDNSIQAITGEHALTDRIESAKKTLRDLPEIFKDYEFLAVEQEVNLGDKAPKKIGENGSVSTNGRLDTIVRDKNTGEIIILDWKGNVKNASPEQLAMYANSRFPEGTLPAGKDGVDKVGFISYLDNNLEKRFKADMSKVTEGIFGKGIEHTTGLIQDIQTLAMRTGFSERAMLREGQKWVGAREFSDDQWAIAEQIVFADMLNELSETGQYREANRSRLEQGGFTSDQIAAMNRQNINDALNDITIKNAIGTGGLDGYVAAQQKYDKMKQWEDALNQISNNISIATYKSNSRAFPAVRNTWLNYNKQIEDSQKELDVMLGSKLIDDERYANYKQRIEDAQTSYYESLSTVSFTDMMAASDRMMKQLSSPAKQTAVTGFAEQFDHLTKRIEYATQAYHALESSIVYEENEKGDRFVSPNSPITEDFLRERTNQFNELKDQEAKLKDEILRKSSIAFDSDFQRMSEFSKYGKLTANTTIKEKISSFNQRLSDARLQLEQDYKDGYLTGNEKEYTRRKSMLDSIRQEDYENTLYTQEAKNSDKLLNQYNKFERRNNMRSGRNVYRQMLNRREDSIDALKNYKEAMSEKYAMWSDRANQIKADWQKENGTDAGHVGYMNLDSWKQASSEVQKYGAAIASVQKQLDSFGNKHTKIASGAEAMIASMNNMITMYARRFARQLVQQAAQFVKQYDAAIKEIKVVTRKSDEEVNQLGENMIKVAKDLKISFADVAKATTELYRQGLSDEEVDERREQVLKFSKVAGVSATDATKLITVGVNSGLFKDAKEVTDVVTALGDSAATNAGQIQKGIQKAGYAAKEAGVSGKELSAMLTVITAGTQLSGNVAGTTLRNVFSRINRVKNPNEVVYDEKGNAMTANTLAAVLNSAGISMYENGQMKGTTQILTDIGKVWDSLSDNKKNQIAYQLGGTQQYSNVAALMAGFSETDENGQTLMEKYLQLADESGNIVDEKYVDQADSLTAALTNLSNAFNALTSSVTDSEAIKSFIDILADAIEGVSELNSALGGVPSLLAAIGIAAVALASHPVIAGILVSILGLGAAYKAISGIINPEPVDYNTQAIENIDKKKDENDKKENSVNNLIEKTTAINKKAQDKTATYEDFVEYNKAASELQHLGISCVSTVSSLEELMNGATNAATELNNAANSAKNLADSNAASILNTLYNSINDGVVSYVEEIEASDKDNERIKEVVSDFITTNFYENKRTGRLDYVLGQGTDLSSIPYEKFSKLWEDPEYLNFANSRYATAHAIALLKSGDLGNIYLKNAHGQRIEAGASTLGINWDNYTNDELRDVITDPAFKEAYTKHYYKTYYDADENDTVPEYDFSVLENKQLGELYRGAIAEAYSSIPSIANSGFLDQTVEYMVQKLNDSAPQFVTKNGDGEYVPNSEMIKAFIVEPWTNDDGTSFDENKYEKFVEDERFKTTNSADTQSSFNLGAIATSAASLSADNKYGNAAVKLYQALFKAKGTPSERFTALKDMIENDTAMQSLVEAMLTDTDNSELAKAFSYMFEPDSENEGKYKIKENASDLDIAVLMSALANADSAGTLLAYNHRSKQNISSNAMIAFSALKGKKPDEIITAWGNLGNTNSLATKMLQEDFSTILGEETTSKLLNGQLNDLGMSYAERMISAYGNEGAGYTDYEYAGLAEQVLGGLDANLTPEDKLAYINSLPTEMIDALKEKISGFEDYVNLATMSAEGKANSGVTDAKVADARKAFELGISDAKIRDLEKYNENLDELATLLTQVGKGGKNAADAMQTINGKMDQNRYNRWALNQYKSGDRSETVTKQLSSGFGIDQAELKEASKTSADFFIKSMEQELEGQTTELNNTASIVLNEMWQDVRQTIPESFDLDSYIGIGGVFNVSGFLNACQEAGIEIDAGFAALLANAASHSATLRLTADGNKLSIDVSGTSAKPKSSGGGGGGKSDADKLVDKIKKGQALYEHRVKMVQYKQTEYTNADELTNYGRMIEKEMEIEQSYLPVVQENIQKLKEQMAKTKVGSDDWYTLRDAILSAEETYEEINKTLDENKKKLEENQQAILKLHTDLEDSVTEEIKNRIQKERDMTDGAVTMQETILNAIKNRLSEEWELQKKDIEKKKEALEEEKSLIDERLQARKDAEDEAEKYEELAELKKQLASVEMDSSRTKDAAQLRKSIADLEKEIGWDIADKEADNAKNEIQDQMDAYDDYITKGDEDLEELLKDANNFSEEVNNVLKMNQSELFDWLKNNVKEYTESLKDAQQQMINSWSDTYKQMMGLTDTYWDEVAEILSSKESYLEYMKNSDEYLNASDDMKAQLRYQWEDAYDKWILALKDTTNYDHFDNGLGDMSGSEYGTGTNSGTGAGGNKTTSPSGLSTMIKNAIETVRKSLFGGLAWDKPNVSKEVLDRIVRGKFATGGVANYTGLAWLDGTPSKPERVLNAQQTESFERLVNVMDSLRASGVSLENLRSSMLDTRIHLPNLSPSIDPSTIGGNIANIGDVNVTIEEAELNDDRDYDEIAQIVGEKFAKEISKQGINIAKYNF